jgi:hypothetical protein
MAQFGGAILDGLYDFFFAEDGFHGVRSNKKATAGVAWGFLKIV